MLLNAWSGRALTLGKSRKLMLQLTKGCGSNEIREGMEIKSINGQLFMQEDSRYSTLSNIREESFGKSERAPDLIIIELIVR